jgi:hypothetical protein
MAWSRRDVCAALPGLLALPVVAGEASPAPAQDHPPSMLGKVYVFDQLTVHSEKSMSASAPPVVLREILKGKITTGTSINLHETDLGPFGIPGHPPHKHRHEEMIMLIEGTLDFELNGVTTRGGAGSVMYSGPYDMHGITNPVAAHAKYYVLELGEEKA